MHEASFCPTFFFESQAFGLDVPTTPTPPPPTPPFVGGEQFHKKGLQPQPKALPLSRGRDATAPTRRSFTKVLLPKVGRREISYATELRLFVFAPLTSMRKTIQLWFLLRLLFAPTLLYGRCRLPRCSLYSTIVNTIYYCKSINTKSTAIQGKNSLSLCFYVGHPPYTISLPKGVRAISANLKCCLPKGMPMMVM